MANIRWSGFEYVGTDPFYHAEAIANAQALRHKQMAKLAHSPVYLEPILNLLWLGVYRLYMSLFMCLIWAGYAVGEHLAKLTDN